MAMRGSPNGGADLRTAVIKLLENHGPISGSSMFSKTTVLKQGVFVGKYRLGYDDFVACQCWTRTYMLNYVYYSGSEHEDPVLCVVA